MRIVGIENIVCDYYFWKDKIYINGGGTIANILITLDALQYSCKLIGYIGDDQQGNWILESLKQTKINRNGLFKIAQRTRCYYIQNQKTISTCPVCNQKKKRYPNLKIEQVINEINQNDMVLLKDYSKINEKIIQTKKYDVLIDIGHLTPFLYLSKECISNYLFQKYKIISIKEEVLNLFLKKLSLQKIELLNNIHAELIVITKGKRGVEFYYQQKLYKFQDKPMEELETNGAGDAFFSIVIAEFLKCTHFEEKNFQLIYEKAIELVKIVLSNLGARNHLIKNQLISQNEKCICDEFNIE